MSRTIILHADGTQTVKDWPMMQRPDLDWLRQAVGGRLAVVPYWITYMNGDDKPQPCRACQPKDAKQEGKPTNTEATRLWQEAVTRFTGQYGLLKDVLTGDVVVLIGGNWFTKEAKDDD